MEEAKDFSIDVVLEMGLGCQENDHIIQSILKRKKIYFCRGVCV